MNRLCVISCAVTALVAIIHGAHAVDYDSGGTVHLNAPVTESSTLSNGTTLNIVVGGSITGPDVVDSAAPDALIASGDWALNMSVGSITGGDNTRVSQPFTVGGSGLLASGDGHAELSGGVIAGGEGVVGGTGAWFTSNSTANISGGDIIAGPTSANLPGNALRVDGAAQVSITGGNRNAVNHTAGSGPTRATGLVGGSAQLTISGAGGTFTAFAAAPALNITQSATADISAGAFTGGLATSSTIPQFAAGMGLSVQGAATVNISGGAFNGGDTPSNSFQGGGRAIAVYEQSTTTITGGTFTGGSPSINAGGDALFAGQDAQVTIAGGTFTPGDGPSDAPGVENAIRAVDNAKIKLAGKPTLNGPIYLEGDAQLIICGQYGYDGETLNVIFADGSKLTATVVATDNAQVVAPPSAKIVPLSSPAARAALVVILGIGGASLIARRLGDKAQVGV